MNSPQFPEQQVEEDIDVSVVGDTLTIKGEGKAETEVNEEDYYCCERSYGSFSRSIVLPSTVDAKKISVSAKKKEKVSK